MLSLAIGREGQNARLAAKLTGWRIDIRSDQAPPRPAPTGAPAADQEKIEQPAEAIQPEQPAEPEQPVPEPIGGVGQAQKAQVPSAARGSC